MRAYVGLVVTLLFACTGCAAPFSTMDASSTTVGLGPGEATRRYAVVFGGKTPHVCLESINPAVRAPVFNINLGASIKNETGLSGQGSGSGKGKDGTEGGAQAGFDYKLGQDVGLNAGLQAYDRIAQLYQIDDIMQLAHAALYRLCEATGNKDMDQTRFAQNYEMVFDKTQKLLEQQMKNDLALALARMHATIALLAQQEDDLRKRHDEDDKKLAKQIDNERSNESLRPRPPTAGPPRAEQLQRERDEAKARNEDTRRELRSRIDALSKQAAELRGAIKDK